MNENYKFVPVWELAKAVKEAPVHTLFDFTFDESEETFFHGTPSGWCGVKFTTIFEEEPAILAIGYYGGGDTEVHDFIEETDGKEELSEWITSVIKRYADRIVGDGNIQKVCVEITDDNKKYF